MRILLVIVIIFSVIDMIIYGFGIMEPTTFSIVGDNLVIALFALSLMNLTKEDDK